MAKPGDSGGAQVGLGLGFQFSDAKTADDLRGPFKYGSGNVGFVYGGYAWDSDTHVYSGGATIGAPIGGAGGVSHSEVMRFSFCDSWLGVCMGPP